MRPFFIFIFFQTLTIPVTAGTFTLRYLYTGVARDVDRFSFSAVLTLNHVPILFYDSRTGNIVPRQEWLREAFDSAFWDTERMRNREQLIVFESTMLLMMQSFNHTTAEPHTYQRLRECKLEANGDVRVSDRFGYDGVDYLSLDQGTGTWIPAVPQAQSVKQKWDADTARTQECRVYLEEECIQVLKTLIRNGTGALERPVYVEVFQVEREPWEFCCLVTGISSSGAEVQWVVDQQGVLAEGQCREELLPNGDGSFQVRQVLRVSQQERERHSYACQVNGTLQEPSFPKLRSKFAFFAFLFTILALSVLVCAGLYYLSVVKTRTQGSDQLRYVPGPLGSTGFYHPGEQHNEP
ncbi:zinc-alpha-2-glycoprotein-like [Lepisosteus oculatus]|uniref:zinc-alpha-2-glycoprotein-like n=1 Tax=Lepisosteus oculatus TaxID=7918 RepID=UPI0035F52A26